ncbi:tyrosine-type recombinase/integrase [Ampullimonas aquatilis]|uniref:tyrosine-type recombinase/integrase n=1 Tax=Ampullimonas aquatilis TaxID=1341549 RepID=UPI003C71DDF5
MDWEVEDLMALAKSMGGSYYLVALIAEFAWLTGQRRQDILKLHASQITDSGIQFKPQKIKRGEIPITIQMDWSTKLRACVDQVKAILRKTSSMMVFSNQSGHAYTDSGFKAIWNRLQVAYAKQGGERFHFHDLRAKYVTDKEARGEDSTLGTGHKNRATVERTYDRRRVRKATPAG